MPSPIDRQERQTPIRFDQPGRLVLTAQTPIPQLDLPKLLSTVPLEGFDHPMIPDPVTSIVKCADVDEDFDAAFEEVLKVKRGWDEIFI
jgi:hypothetical protein